MAIPTNNQIKASVILLTYCQEKTVERAIRSLLQQKCSHRFEIVVADDGSTDRTRDICRKYADDYPELFRLLPQEPNKGIVDNYFDAVLATRGEYVSDCAGDDEWLDPLRLQRQIDALDADSSLMAVCCDVEAYRPVSGSKQLLRGSVFAEASFSSSTRADGKSVLKGVLNNVNALPFVLSGALYRKKPVEELLIKDPDVLRCHDGGVEDVPLIAAIGALGDTLHLPFTGYRYYIDGESISNGLSYEKEYRFYAGVSTMVRRLGKHYGLSTRDQIDFFRSKFPYLAAQARHAGKKELAEDLKKRISEWDLPMPFRGRIHQWLLRLALMSRAPRSHAST